MEIETGTGAEAEERHSVFTLLHESDDTVNTWRCAYYVIISSVNCGIHI